MKQTIQMTSILLPEEVELLKAMTTNKLQYGNQSGGGEDDTPLDFSDWLDDE